MPNSIDNEIARTLSRAAHRLTGAETDFDSLLAHLANKRIVLLGEASHGTHEFYRARAEITKRLITQHGFNHVAVEADFPDAARVNRFVCAAPQADRDADSALKDFQRFPLWMWRNHDVLDFLQWLRAHNDAQARDTPGVNFYGIDLYSLHSSIEAVLQYLKRVDPEAASRARSRYECFEHFEDSQAYGYATSAGHAEPCEDKAVAQLIEMQRRAVELATRAGNLATGEGRQAADDFFTAEQNARLVQNAEEYYRSMFRGRVSSWNLRDRHMTETIEALVQYAEWRGETARIVVWAHNSHLGDARFTEMRERGEWNVGQLVRERFGSDAALVGFTTYTGSVTAASNWGDDPEYKRVRPGIKGSYEELFHRVAELHAPNFVLTWRAADEVAKLLREPRLERAIGVIYRPETERYSHYFEAHLADQFDHVIHFDSTRAVRPLEPPHAWTHEAHEAGKHEAGACELPDTYPTGM